MIDPWDTKSQRHNVILRLRKQICDDGKEKQRPTITERLKKSKEAFVKDFVLASDR